MPDNPMPPAPLIADLSDFPALQGNTRSVVFTPEMGEIILGLYTEGMSLQKIATLDGMPNYGTILRWFRDSKKFVTDLDSARRARALHFEEKALAVADVDGPIDKDDVAGERLKFDVYKWGAEVADPNRFGKKVTVGGDPDRPVIFRVVTGVPAPTASQQAVTLNADGTQRLPDIEVGSGSSDKTFGNDGGASVSAEEVEHQVSDLEGAGSSPAPTTLPLGEADAPLPT